MNTVDFNRVYFGDEINNADDINIADDLAQSKEPKFHYSLKGLTFWVFFVTGSNTHRVGPSS